MERFELAETEEARNERYENFKKELNWPDWKLQACDILDSKNPRRFGLEHGFPNLTKRDQRKIDKLFEQRESLLKDYRDIADKLNVMLEKEFEIWNNLEFINQRICELQGHRLSDKTEEIIDGDGYGDYLLLGYSRNCLVCGKRISECNLNETDVVVEGEFDNPQRVKIKVKK